MRSLNNASSGTHSLIPRPLPPEERPGIHCLCMCEVFHYIFHKKLCTLFACMQKIILTKNTELLWNRHKRRYNLQNPAGILLFRRSSIIFLNVQSNRKVINKLIYQKGPLVATASLRTRFVAAPLWTRSAFTTEMALDTALASSESLGASCSHSLVYLRETNMHGSYT